MNYVGPSITVSENSHVHTGRSAINAGRHGLVSCSIAATYTGVQQGEQYPERVGHPCVVISENRGVPWPFVVRFDDGFCVLADRSGWKRRFF
jgi:hypothetical protein